MDIEADVAAPLAHSARFPEGGADKASDPVAAPAALTMFSEVAPAMHEVGAWPASSRRPYERRTPCTVDNAKARSCR